MEEILDMLVYHALLPRSLQENSSHATVVQFFLIYHLKRGERRL